MKIKHLVFSIIMLFTLQAWCNNVQVSNVRLTGQDTTGNFTLVEFDISWENSWRYSGGPANWDAAWIFVKYKVGSAGAWQHAWLNNTGHIQCSGMAAANGLLTPGSAFHPVTNPVIGQFLYRSTPGTGNINCQNVQLRWNYGANGVTDIAIIDVQVLAIEFVYIPQGGFHIGSGGTEPYRFYTYPNSNTPFQITGENVMITVGTTNGNLYYNAIPPNDGGDQSGPVPAAFPKGFGAYYAMKYEISQKAYVDFLNTLTRQQQIFRVDTDLSGISITNKFVMTITSSPVYRNGISCRPALPPPPGPVEFFCDLNNNGVGNESADGLGIACNFLSYGDVAAYLDWAALRLMTVFEFEKCGRGIAAPVPNEHAWGNNVIFEETGLSNAGHADEVPIDPYANVAGPSSNGPLRNGAFARPFSTRTTSGAGYYGCLELTGNVFERCVTISNPAGRSYTGIHGNGILTSGGDHDVSNWPSATTGIGNCLHGGTWEYSTNRRISDRALSGYSNESPLNDRGGRGVRTAE